MVPGTRGPAGVRAGTRPACSWDSQREVGDDGEMRGVGEPHFAGGPTWRWARLRCQGPAWEGGQAHGRRPPWGTLVSPSVARGQRLRAGSQGTDRGTHCAGLPSPGSYSYSDPWWRPSPPAPAPASLPSGAARSRSPRRSEGASRLQPAPQACIPSPHPLQCLLGGGGGRKEAGQEPPVTSEHQSPGSRPAGARGPAAARRPGEEEGPALCPGKQASRPRPARPAASGPFTSHPGGKGPA